MALNPLLHTEGDERCPPPAGVAASSLLAVAAARALLLSTMSPGLDEQPDARRLCTCQQGL